MKGYANCCQPFHTKKATPQTPEQLMRSRYSAYVKKEMKYLFATHHPSTLDPQMMSEAKSWADQVKWLGLEVVQFLKKKNTVEFKADYLLNGEKHRHHEISRFVFEQGRWFYVDGEIKS